MRQVQEVLKQKGFNPGPIDGKMGPQTEQALKTYQQSKNLKPTGKIDDKTGTELGLSGASTEKTGSSVVGPVGPSTGNQSPSGSSSVGPVGPSSGDQGSTATQSSGSKSSGAKSGMNR